MAFNIENSSPEFLAKLKQRLTEYRNSVGTCLPQRCRMVQYAGADKPNGLDIAPAQIEYEISFALAEGFVVDWLLENSVLYICTQEPGCPAPPWDKVKAEEALIDVDALLRKAGFDV
ncbi:hypothetical protein HAV22_18995 [Massilia sp. TW-1]|uniref:Uncharacterized protein n=1 Tax=Telluria antibiotica TaxID=2717319 RepID=A0ABX0PER0_9BURK|nr:hypothetical protein [Telluria antibiotica]NIA55726.1 hypothetical protein [Telluria antibiotica]